MDSTSTDCSSGGRIQVTGNPKPWEEDLLKNSQAKHSSCVQVVPDVVTEPYLSRGRCVQASQPLDPLGSLDQLQHRVARLSCGRWQLILLLSVDQGCLPVYLCVCLSVGRLGVGTAESHLRRLDTCESSGEQRQWAALTPRGPSRFRSRRSDATRGRSSCGLFCGNGEFEQTARNLETQTQT